jgi:ABC-type metal ion transport system substrate-binding protein
MIIYFSYGITSCPYLSVINFFISLDCKTFIPHKDAIAIEGKSSPFANIVAVQEGHKNDKKFKELMKDHYQSHN